MPVDSFMCSEMWKDGRVGILSLKPTPEAPSARLAPGRSQFRLPTGAGALGRVLSGVAAAGTPLRPGSESEGGAGWWLASPPPPSPGWQRCASPSWEESATRICHQVRRSMQGEREEAPWSSPLSPALGCLSCWLSRVGKHLRRSPRRSPQLELRLPSPGQFGVNRNTPRERQEPPCLASRFLPSVTQAELQSGTPRGRWSPDRRRKLPVPPGPHHPTGSPHFFTRPPTPGLPDGELPARPPSARQPGRRGDSVATQGTRCGRCRAGSSGSPSPAGRNRRRPGKAPC